MADKSARSEWRLKFSLFRGLKYVFNTGKAKSFNSEMIDYQCNLRNIIFLTLLILISDMSVKAFEDVTSIISCGAYGGYHSATLRWKHMSFQLQH